MFVVLTAMLVACSDSNGPPSEIMNQEKRRQNKTRSEDDMKWVSLIYIESILSGEVVGFLVEDGDKIQSIVEMMNNIHQSFPEAPESRQNLGWRPETIISYFKNRNIASNIQDFEKKYAELRDGCSGIFDSYLVVDDRKVTKECLEELYKTLGLDKPKEKEK
jgi:hypothetical protein